MRVSILTFVRHYVPGYKSGGPLQSIANIVESIGDEFNFKIVTSDRDAGDQSKYFNVDCGKWKLVGKAQVMYLAPRQRSLKYISSLMRNTPHDIVYCNSFFDPWFATVPILARRLSLVPQRPVVLAPRGEFSPGALELKWLKKWLFLGVVRTLQLHSGLTWQASSEYEAEDVSRIMGRLARDIRIAPDLPRRGAFRLQETPRWPRTPLRVVFLSRISPKKNLLFALEVLSRVMVPVEFTIIGPVADRAYWADCQAAITALPDHIQVKVLGPVPPEEVIDALADHHLFFLPTRGENFCHVVAEALQAGLPVLISDQTPWRGLAEAGIGRDLPLAKPEQFVRYIEKCAMQSNEEAQYLQRSLVRYIKEKIDQNESVERMRELFLSINSNCVTRVIHDS